MAKNKILKNILFFLGSFFLGCSVKLEPSSKALLSAENSQIDIKTFELTPFKPEVVYKTSSIPTLRTSCLGSKVKKFQNIGEVIGLWQIGIPT